MPLAKPLSNNLSVGLFGRVSDIRRFFELFADAADHEFILSGDEVLEDWKHNCSLARYVLEPIYWELKDLAKDDDPATVLFAKQNLARWVGTQKRIIELWDWLEQKKQFNSDIKVEIVEQCGGVGGALEIWCLRLIRDLRNVGDPWGQSLIEIAGSDKHKDRESVCLSANELFPGNRQSTRARFRNVIKGSLRDLVEGFRESINLSKHHLDNFKTISDDFKSPLMQMCIKARRLYLAAFQAIITAKAEITEDVIREICAESKRAAQVAHDALPDQKSKNLKNSLDNLTYRLKILETYLPSSQFQLSALMPMTLCSPSAVRTIESTSQEF